MCASLYDPLLRALCERFFVRRDAWVEQTRAGRYRARRGALAERDLRAHLVGGLSLCAYCLVPETASGEPRALWGAFDLDAHGAELGADGRLEPAARRALREGVGALAGGLSALIGPQAVLCEATGGRGAHVWALLGAPCPAALVMALMDAALARAGHAPGARIELSAGLVVERYPKSEALGDGRFGFSLRVPFGVHPRGGRRSVAFDPTTGAVADSLAALERAARTGLDAKRLAACLGDADRSAPVRRAPRPARPERPSAPDAWLTYRWAAARLGLSDRTSAPPPAGAFGRGYPVRCLFPAAHVHGDLGAGSAYLIRRGEAQIYGCSVCGGGMAMDTIALVRRIEPGLSFTQALEYCHEIDPLRCPSRRNAEGLVPSGRRRRSG
jgi:hypothetical protein